MFDHLERSFRRLANEHTGTRSQAFELAHIGVGALVDIGATGFLDQQGGERIAPALGAGGKKLRHQRVAITIHHQAGQAVALAMHQAQRAQGALRHQFTAQRQRSAQAAAEKRLVYGFGRIKTPDAGANLRLRAECGAGAQAAAGIAHLDRIARLRIAARVVYGAGKNPRVHARQQFFAAGLEDNVRTGFHGGSASAG